MKTTVAAILALSCGVAVACERREATPPGMMAEEGCITAAGEQFVLTDVESGSPLRRFDDRTATSPAAKTEAYLLVGADQKLQSLVGQHVRVTGEIVPTQTAELREVTPMMRVDSNRPTGTAGQSGREPRVRSEQRVSLEVHEMRVRSVDPTGDSCDEYLD